MKPGESRTEEADISKEFDIKKPGRYIVRAQRYDNDSKVQTDSEKHLERLNSLAKGQGRLWITDSRVTHSHGSVSPQNGAIEWLKFSVEIKLPKLN